MKKSIISLCFFLISFILFAQTNTTAFLFSFENTTDVTINNLEGTPTFSIVGILAGPNFFAGQSGQSISYASWNSGDGLRFSFNSTGGNNLRFQYYIRCSSTDVGTFKLRISNDLTNWTDLEAEFLPTTSFILHGPYTIPSIFDDKTSVFIDLYKSNDAVSSLNNIRLDEVKLIGDGPLPVELISFTALVEIEKVNLTWSTATEVNNYGFNIERRIQNEEWNKIGFVHGSGNSNSPKSYTFTDQPLGGIYFKYRLKQIDFDGTYEYSNEVDVTLNKINNFTLEQNYPNPFNPTTTIRFSLPIESFVTIKVFNLLGEQVSEVIRQSLKEGFHEIKFDGSNLASGVYFYHLNAGDFKATRKFIVAR
jgi:hypothetical protein